MSKGYCKTCDESFDLIDNLWIDNDEMPIVLDIQLKGGSTERKAINFVRAGHDINDVDYAGDDDKLHMYHHDQIGDLSHEEPGTDEHFMEMPKTGFWSFQ